MNGLYSDKLTGPSLFDNAFASQRDGPGQGLIRGLTEICAITQGIPLYCNGLDNRKAHNNRPNYYIVILFLGII